MPRKYWLSKADPEDYSIDDLADEPAKTTSWDGIRNYMARNLLRDEIKKGDEVLFYHSNSNPKGVVGICRIVKSGYPDSTARISKSKYFDPKATEENPIWYMVDVKLVRKLPMIIELSVLKETGGLEKMMVTQRGSRLSIQPVTQAEWDIIMKLAGC